MVLTGEPIDARAALQAGLISEVCVDALTLERTQQMADRISRQAPLALRAAKQALKQAEEIGLSRGWRWSVSSSSPRPPPTIAAKASPPFRKRTPNYQGADLWITH